MGGYDVATIGVWLAARVGANYVRTTAGYEYAAAMHACHASGQRDDGRMQQMHGLTGGAAGARCMHGDGDGCQVCS